MNCETLNSEFYDLYANANELQAMVYQSSMAQITLIYVFRIWNSTRFHINELQAMVLGWYQPSIAQIILICVFGVWTINWLWWTELRLKYSVNVEQVGRHYLSWNQPSICNIVL